MIKEMLNWFKKDTYIIEYRFVPEKQNPDIIAGLIKDGLSLIKYNKHICQAKNVFGLCKICNRMKVIREVRKNNNEKTKELTTKQRRRNNAKIRLREYEIVAC